MSDKLARHEQRAHNDWVKRTFYTSVKSYHDTPTTEVSKNVNGKGVSVIIYDDEGTKPEDFQCLVSIDGVDPVLIKASEVDAFISNNTK